MNEKLKEATGPGPASGEENGGELGGGLGLRVRTVPLPAGVTAKELGRLAPEDIDALIQQTGKAVGYEAIFKLSCGIGGTPPNTQLLAAKFLVEQADRLDEQGANADEVLKRLRGADPATLRSLIAQLEAQGAGRLPVLDQEPEQDGEPVPALPGA